eukprot:CAMPEP_0194363322 /NCGR_PEP_ID=MMETSP0174-20130528/11136_1 /TAXON_ID=216777 /ORGANISM="Proboscia alata, Strain PI-D3" /LENGTH=723 /DNA_ID=CAMNT_0039136677 /DNA_START=56 /DNA_END=2223 /DNA_ORIENTATION=+
MSLNDSHISRITAEAANRNETSLERLSNAGEKQVNFNISSKADEQRNESKSVKQIDSFAKSNKNEVEMKGSSCDIIADDDVLIKYFEYENERTFLGEDKMKARSEERQSEDRRASLSSGSRVSFQLNSTSTLSSCSGNDDMSELQQISTQFKTPLNRRRNSTGMWNKTQRRRSVGMFRRLPHEELDNDTDHNQPQQQHSETPTTRRMSLLQHLNISTRDLGSSKKLCDESTQAEQSQFSRQLSFHNPLQAAKGYDTISSHIERDDYNMNTELSSCAATSVTRWNWNKDSDAEQSKNSDISLCCSDSFSSHSLAAASVSASVFSSIFVESMANATLEMIEELETTNLGWMKADEALIAEAHMHIRLISSKLASLNIECPFKDVEKIIPPFGKMNDCIKKQLIENRFLSQDNQISQNDIYFANIDNDIADKVFLANYTYSENMCPSSLCEMQCGADLDDVFQRYRKGQFNRKNKRRSFKALYPTQKTIEVITSNLKGGPLRKISSVLNLSTNEQISTNALPPDELLLELEPEPSGTKDNLTSPRVCTVTEASPTMYIEFPEKRSLLRHGSISALQLYLKDKITQKGDKDNQTRSPILCTDLKTVDGHIYKPNDNSINTSQIPNSMPYSNVISRGDALLEPERSKFLRHVNEDSKLDNCSDSMQYLSKKNSFENCHSFFTDTTQSKTNKEIQLNYSLDSIQRPSCSEVGWLPQVGSKFDGFRLVRP